MMRKFAYILLICVSFLNCTKKKQFSENEIVTKWAEMALFITKNTPANTPTYASRCFGYIGLTMYESVVESFPEQQSIISQLNDFPSNIPRIKGKNNTYIISFNAAQAMILKQLYNQTSDENKAKIDSLENEILENIKLQSIDNQEIESFVLYGKTIANQIFEWSKNDGGHRAYLKNFDKNLKFKEKKGGWKPPLYAQSFSHYPLHPHWGENRTFLQKNSEVVAPPMLKYNTEIASPYYQQFLMVYEKERTLTQAEKEAAIWWGDDPDDTFTPPGHSFYLATVALEKAKSPFISRVETYAKIGLSVADAFQNCWKWKYFYFSERPNTFIPQFIDSEWDSFWPDPPFPAFPSGHAINAAASATVLTNQLGDNFAFSDSSHVGRKRDEIRDVDFVPRHFSSFWEMAHETANSRFYGGIHTSQDNEAGLNKGKEIAQNVLDLKWKK